MLHHAFLRTIIMRVIIICNRYNISLITTYTSEYMKYWITNTLQTNLSMIVNISFIRTGNMSHRRVSAVTDTGLKAKWLPRIPPALIFKNPLLFSRGFYESCTILSKTFFFNFHTQFWTVLFVTEVHMFSVK